MSLSREEIERGVRPYADVELPFLDPLTVFDLVSGLSDADTKRLNEAVSAARDDDEFLQITSEWLKAHVAESQE